MGKPARKTAFPFIPKPGHCNTSTCSFNEENAENSKNSRHLYLRKNFLHYSYIRTRNELRQNNDKTLHIHCRLLYPKNHKRRSS